MGITCQTMAQMGKEPKKRMQKKGFYSLRTPEQLADAELRKKLCHEDVKKCMGCEVWEACKFGQEAARREEARKQEDHACTCGCTTGEKRTAKSA